MKFVFLNKKIESNFYQNFLFFKIGQSLTFTYKEVLQMKHFIIEANIKLFLSNNCYITDKCDSIMLG